jgi:hypothetical protein
MSSDVHDLLRAKVAELEPLAADQEREMLEEKRQYDEAQARLDATRASIASLKENLPPEEEPAPATSAGADEPVE